MRLQKCWLDGILEITPLEAGLPPLLGQLCLYPAKLCKPSKAGTATTSLQHLVKKAFLLASLSLPICHVCLLSLVTFPETTKKGLDLASLYLLFRQT